MKRNNSLAKILLGSDEKKKKASLCEAIDDACRNGGVFDGYFSLRGIRKQLKELSDILDSDEFDRDKFFSAFFSFYNGVMSPDRRAEGVFHPSQLLNGCARAFYYELCGTPPSNEVPRTISASLQRVFDVGTWYHVYMQGILYKIGYLEQAEVPVVNEEKYLSGHADGVIKEKVFGERVLLEIKTMNSWTFQRAAFKPYKHHEFQASLYARELGIRKILFLYINKDTSEIREFLVPLNEEQLKIADEKMNLVIDAVKTKTEPERVCTGSTADGAFACPYRNLCFNLK